MPKLIDASPACSVWLFKTIDRKTVSGSAPTSERYQGQMPYIDLSPHLGDVSTVRTSKSVKEPSGGFSVSFTDKPEKDWVSVFSPPGFQALESVYGLVEPMDIIEIRMWNGLGPWTGNVYYPIIMRGFITEVSRSQTMGADGKPQRIVTITGHDYGKIWQMLQVLHLPQYAEGKGLLTSYAMAELFGVSAKNAMAAGEFIRTMVEKIINPHLDKFLPETLPLDIPKDIQTGDSISVAHGQVGLSFQNMQGSIYDIMKFHGDVGHWNELYTEDREDGVHCVYRSIPALHLSTKEKIMDDAPDPVFCTIYEPEIESISVARSDANVANFYWVDSAKFDMISDMSRKLHAVSEESVSLKDYPNSAVKYYGARAMYASTQQGGDDVTNQGSGLPKAEHEKRDTQQMSWVDKRRKQLMDMNKDNVVFERGSARVKGGPLRNGSTEPMKAGDYAVFSIGDLTWIAYVYQVDHEFIPYQGYTTTLLFERGEGFATRITLEGASASPWLAEQKFRI